ncbi:MAG: S1C family serine protease [Bdellovibrionota bacterium]
MWHRIFEKSKAAVVSIEVDVRIPLFSEDSGTFYGTGLVIDPKQGLIVVSQQVAKPGKLASAKAKFFNQQTVDIKLLHMDPWHDFSVFQYDPRLIHISIPRLQFEAPSNLSEQQAILGISHSWEQGLIQREGKINKPFVVRAENKLGRYSQSIDTGQAFESLLIGSPIFTKKGRVLGFHSKGSDTSSIAISAQYVEAMLKVLPGSPPPRGDIQWSLDIENVFDAEQFYKLSSRYVPRDTYGSPAHPFVLKVTRTVQGSEAQKKLLPGDLLLYAREEKGEWRRIGQDIYGLDHWIDGQIGKTIEFKISRLGKQKTVRLNVRDAYQNMPDRFMTFAGSTFHAITPTLSMIYHVDPDAGMYIADTLHGTSFGSSSQYGTLLMRFDAKSLQQLRILGQDIFAFSKPKSCNCTIH